MKKGHDEDAKWAKRELPASLPRDPRASETHGKQTKPSGVHVGIDTTIGPSEIPSNATLPPAEPVVPGKGRSPH